MTEQNPDGGDVPRPAHPAALWDVDSLPVPRGDRGHIRARLFLGGGIRFGPRLRPDRPASPETRVSPSQRGAGLHTSWLVLLSFTVCLKDCPSGPSFHRIGGTGATGRLVLDRS